MVEAKLHEIMTLKNKSLNELRAKYEELFDGQKPTYNNKAFLWRKLAVLATVSLYYPWDSIE